MYSTQQYLRKSQKNKEFAESIPLGDATNVGWAMTALFYSALHAVNAYLSKCHKSCSDHGERDREILEDPKLQGIYDEYRDLKVFSQNARYHMHSYSQSQFQEAQNCLNTIQDHIDPLI